MKKIEVWGTKSIRSFRVIWILEELGLKYVHHKVETRTPELYSKKFEKINPKQKIPVIKYEDFVLTESAAICIFLNENFDKKNSLYKPRGVKNIATFNEWCFFIMTELDSRALTTIRFHKDLKKIYGSSPVAVKAAEIYFKRLMSQIKYSYSISNPYLFGSKLSVADILMVTCIKLAKYYNLEVQTKWIRYNNFISKRNSFLRALKINYG